MSPARDGHSKPIPKNENGPLLAAARFCLLLVAEDYFFGAAFFIAGFLADIFLCALQAPFDTILAPSCRA
jgi:hypothetical protein